MSFQDLRPLFLPPQENPRYINIRWRKLPRLKSNFVLETASLLNSLPNPTTGSQNSR